MSKVKVELRCGDRFAGEYIDLDEERKDYDASTWSKKKPAWEHYIRPVTSSADDIEDLNGNHFVFGYLEALFQSDISSPAFFLEEDNDFDWVVTVSKVE